MDSSLKPYVVVVTGDVDYQMAIREFMEINLPGLAVFIASNSVEAIHTMHQLDRSAIFIVEYDLPDMDGLLLITQNIRKTFRFDSFCFVMTDNTELIGRVSDSKISCRRKSMPGENRTERRTYNLDAFFAGDIRYALADLKELRVDPLTKIYTREQGMKRWARDFARARAIKSTTAFILGDLNYLKWVNDTYGHLAGDMLIQAAADAFRRKSRDPYDYAIRLGGDELGLVMSETKRGGAEKALYRIKEYLKNTVIEVKKGVFITPSMAFGISVLKPTSLGRSAVEAFHKMYVPADENMFRDKRSMKISHPPAKTERDETFIGDIPPRLLIRRESKQEKNGTEVP